MIKINMGCGWRNFGHDWVHIDGGNYEHVKYHDIVCLKQFENETVDLIYASHVIEYFDRFEILEVLKEWKRILKPRGTLRIAVPDFEKISNLYNSGIELERFLGPLFGRMEMNDERIYHKTVYDFRTLKKLLLELNFVDIERFDWRQTEHSHFDDHSQAYFPHMDKENGTLISLNIECRK